MRTAVDRPALLHQDESGDVWARRGAARAERLAAVEDLDEWLRRNGASHVRLVAGYDNAGLLLWLRREAGWAANRVWLCRPQLVDADPNEVLARISTEPAMPASLGGPRICEDADLIVAEISEILEFEDGLDGIGTLLPRHPAWPALSFPTNGDNVARANLLCLLNDPRWWVDPNKPDSPARLLRRLSLRGKDADAILRAALGDPETGDMDARVARMLLEAWGWFAGREATPGGRYFPWPHVAEAPGEVGFAMLRGSQAYVRLVCESWVAAVSSCRDMFVPRLFFNDREHEADWRRHVASLVGSHGEG